MLGSAAVLSPLRQMRSGAKCLLRRCCGPQDDVGMLHSIQIACMHPQPAVCSMAADNALYEQMVTADQFPGLPTALSMGWIIATPASSGLQVLRSVCSRWWQVGGALRRDDGSVHLKQRTLVTTTASCEETIHCIIWQFDSNVAAMVIMTNDDCNLWHQIIQQDSRAKQRR